MKYRKCKIEKLMREGRIEYEHKFGEWFKKSEKAIVAKELIGEEWEEQQAAVNKLEEVVTYLNDASAKGIGFEEIVL